MEFLNRHLRDKTMRPSATARAAVAVLFMSFTCCLPLLAIAQTNTEPTIALVEARLAALRATDADPATTEIIRNYELARDSLVRAESYSQSASDYVNALTTAPAEEALIRERLDRPDIDTADIEDSASPSPGDLQTRLSLARIELNEANSRLSELDRQIATRESNAEALRNRLEEISRLLDNLPSPAIIVDAGAAPSLSEARSWRVVAERTELNAERRALQAQLTSMPARYSLISAQRAEQLVTATRIAGSVRAMEAQATENSLSGSGLGDIGVPSSHPAYPVATGLLERDSVLRSQLAVSKEKLSEIRLQLATVQGLARDLDEAISRAQRTVEFAADSDTLGRVLLAYLHDLSSFNVARPAHDFSREVSDAVLSRIEHEKVLSGASSARAHVELLLQDGGHSAGDIDENVLSNLVPMARSYRDQLREAIATESEYIEQLTALDVASTSLSGTLTEFHDYLESLILWAPTRAVLWESDFGRIPAEINSMRASVMGLSLSLSVWAIVAFAGLLALVLARPSITARIEALTKAAAGNRRGQGQDALLTLLLIALRSSPLPLLLLMFSTSISDAGIRVGLNLSDGLVFLALAFVALETLRFASQARGAGVCYLNWSAGNARQANREFNWLTRRWLPIAAAALFTVLLAPDIGDVVVARLAILAAAGMLAVRLLSGIAARARESSTPWHQGLLNKCSLAALAVTGVIMLGVVLGRGIGVVVLISTSLATAYIVIGALIVHGLATSWLRDVQHRRRASDMRPQASQDETSAKEDEEPSPEDWAKNESLAQQLVDLTVLALGLVAAILIWKPWLTALDEITNIVLLTSESIVDGLAITNELTLGDVLGAALVFAITLITARRLPALLELVLNDKTRVSTGVRYAIKTLARYIVIGTGLLMTLSHLGFDWAQLKWLVAALGVGIGFGLQEIVANFISGLIILFERPIRVGDIVTIGTQAGQVTRIQIRATTIRDWDGKELLVPNKEFITGQLTNWTLTDSNTRLVIPVGIAYGSNVDQAMNLLSGVLDGHPAVLADPAPLVLFTGFGDSALNLEARCFVSDVTKRLKTASELHREINSVFRDAGITIAFPQRDVHLDTQKPVKVILDQGETGSPG